MKDAAKVSPPKATPGSLSVTFSSAACYVCMAAAFPFIVCSAARASRKGSICGSHCFQGAAFLMHGAFLYWATKATKAELCIHGAYVFIINQF